MLGKKSIPLTKAEAIREFGLNVEQAPAAVAIAAIRDFGLNPKPTPEIPIMRPLAG